MKGTLWVSEKCSECMNNAVTAQTDVYCGRKKLGGHEWVRWVCAEEDSTEAWGGRAPVNQVCSLLRVWIQQVQTTRVSRIYLGLSLIQGTLQRDWKK